MKKRGYEMKKGLMVFSLGMMSAGVLAAVTVEKIELKPGDETAKKAYFAQKIRFWGTNEYKASPEHYNTLLTLTNAKIQFAFRLEGKIVDGKPRKVAVGMFRPSIYNWYSGGFIEVIANKQNLTDGEFELAEFKGGAESGYALLRYTGPEVSGTLRLELADNDDKLQVKFTPSPAKILRGYQLVLISYPGAYGEKENRKREIQTNTGTAENGKKELTKSDCWAVFYDSYYDRKENRGDGCCAFLFNPKEIVSGTLRAGYGCIAYLNYPPHQEANLILWDFKKWSAEDAIAYMKKLSVQFE